MARNEANSVAEQKLRSEIAIALRALTEAEGVCELTMRDRENRFARRKAAEAHEKLRLASRILKDIGPLYPRYDTSDPDLALEPTRGQTRSKGRLSNGQ